MDQLIDRPLRLINVETRHIEPVKWQNYDASNAPRYASLSHTWGPDNTEVSLSEWQNASDNVKARAGYRKIVGVCELAKKEKWGFVWVDTCCIDKSDKEELSRSINTPPVVKFYTRDWKGLGTRATLVNELEGITGIDRAVLDKSTPLSDCSAAQKFSWASRRITTEPADLAYALLGIVGVQMRLNYSEGEGASFRRLQEKVLKKGDLSVLAWSLVEPDRSTHLFARRPSDFYGGGTIVPDQSGYPPEYWSSNIGIKGIFSLCRRRGSHNEHNNTVLALLGCRPRSTRDEVYGLRLSIGRAALTGGNMHLTVEPVEQEELVHGNPSDVALLSRLTTVTRLEASKAEQVHGTIMFDGTLLAQRSNAEASNSRTGVARQNVPPVPASLRSEDEQVDAVNLANGQSPIRTIHAHSPHQQQNMDSETTSLLRNGRTGIAPARSRSSLPAEPTNEDQHTLKKSPRNLWLWGVLSLAIVVIIISAVALLSRPATTQPPDENKNGTRTTASASGTHSATSDSRASETASFSRTSSTISESTAVSASDTHSITSKFTASGTASASSTSSTIALTGSTSTPRSTPSPIQVAEDSGIAVVSAEGSSFYGYYQNSYGDIVEAEFPDASFVAIASADRNRTVVIAESTFLGTPIAATSWTSRSGTVYNLDDMILVTNTTGTESWSEPYGILNTDLAAPEGRVLAAASGTSSTGFNGVRVYYGISIAP
ncbi:hypothetical protein LTR56_017178 [Elasticomyces elasticus]|nr:hypothetical protein LTR56_017178 [Elasticomyces elasticus]KAK3666294.1 hypothetical protein LTR22_002958 [Elasticomyces elasticus]KAK4926890.1 hypothetical protein LTR49_006306 [Elasticomyces elasticus]KAK5752679.1 hypothetical protein LTS12_017248 [Elasticomyces elasticus]